MTGVVRYIFTGIEANTALKLLQQKEPVAKMAIIFPGSKEVLQQLYAALSNLPGGSPVKFFFIIKADMFVDNRVEEVGRFFFLPNYFFLNNNVPLIAFIENSTQAEQLSNNWCYNQGFDKPDILHTSDFESAVETENSLLVVNAESRARFFNSLFHKLKSLQWLKQLIMIKAGNVEEALTINRQLREFTDLLKLNDNNIYDFLSAYTILDQDYKNSLIKLRFLEQEVNNLRSYNNLLKDSSETNKILQFYHTQYEVLPLWYKRFGHIIKIAMGKRKVSFISNSRKN